MRRYSLTRRAFTACFKLLLGFFLCWPLPGLTAESGISSPSSGQAQGFQEFIQAQPLEDHDFHVAPVVVNGEILFQLRGMSSLPASKRVRKVSRRIEALAKNPEFDPQLLRYQEMGNRTNYFAGQDPTLLFTLLDEDAALESVSRDVLSEVLLEKIQKTIKSYRYERKPEVLKENVYKAFLRTLGLVLTLVVVTLIFRRTDSFLEKQLKRRITDLEVKSLSIIRAEQIWKIFRVGLRILRTLIYLMVAYVFLTFVLNLFPWTRYFSVTALDYLLDPLMSMGAAILSYIPSIVFLILLYYITRYLLKMVYRFFQAIEREYISFSGFDAEWSLPTYRIVRVVVIVFALVVAYPYIPGSSSEAFKGLSIMFGLLFSLGSTSVISNVVAGYTMTYRRAFRIGDRVKIGETVGDVLQTRILVTHVRTLKNEEVVIPNSTIINSEVVNYSTLASGAGLILHTTVGIGYEVPWRQVEAMLLLAADRTEGIAREPKPFVLQKALADFSVNYELNVYCRDEKQAMPLYSAMHRNIQDVFNENEISIMTPAYVADTDEPKIVPEGQWYASPAEVLEQTSSKGDR